MDLRQLTLYSLHDVHVVGDVNIADVSTGDEEILQLREAPLGVTIEHLLQAYVHERVHVDHPAPCCALVPQVHCGHLPPQALQEHHHAVLCDGALADGAETLRLA